MEVPPGYVRHFKTSPLTDPWEPLFSIREPSKVKIGLFAGDAHCNSRGFLHGGIIAALADNAMGLSCAEQLDGISGGVTVHMGIDYLATGIKGQWIEFDTYFTKVGRAVSFANCEVTANGEVIARGNAVYQILRKNT
jgi:uncharacterized protein (TIGR00369 family)